MLDARGMWHGDRKKKFGVEIGSEMKIAKKGLRLTKPRFRKRRRVERLLGK